MFIVFPELKAQFGRQIRQEMLQDDIIYTVFSKSKKMVLKEQQEYLSEVHIKNIPDKTVLLVDFWSQPQRQGLD